MSEKVTVLSHDRILALIDEPVPTASERALEAGKHVLASNPDLSATELKFALERYGITGASASSAVSALLAR